MPHDERRDEVGDLARALARMQEELRRQETARRAFVSTASHELRTPLTMLQGTMELLEEDLRAGRLDLADALQQVGDRAARAAPPVRARGRAARPLAARRRRAAALGARRARRDRARGRGGVRAARRASAARRSTSCCPTAPCWGRGDPDASPASCASCSTTRCATARRARRCASARTATHGHAMITVADRGPGVPPQEREHIFERFHRGSAAGSEGGFGLGLAIGRELARRMGGDLDARRDRPRRARASSSRCAARPRRAADGPRASATPRARQRLRKTVACTGLGGRGNGAARLDVGAAEAPVVLRYCAPLLRAQRGRATSRGAPAAEVVDERQDEREPPAGRQRVQQRREVARGATCARAARRRRASPSPRRRAPAR